MPQRTDTHRVIDEDGNVVAVRSTRTLYVRPSDADASRLLARLALLPAVQAEDTLTTADLETAATLFLEWEPGVAYAVGDVVAYMETEEEGLRLWEVRQAHTSQADWTPPDVLSLFYRYRGADEAAVWEPSTPYVVDDEVTYEGAAYRCIQAHTSQVGWEPPNVPSLWTAI